MLLSDVPSFPLSLFGNVDFELGNLAMSVGAMSVFWHLWMSLILAPKMRDVQRQQLPPGLFQLATWQCGASIQPGISVD
jgi:hypothetical protein